MTIESAGEIIERKKAEQRHDTNYDLLLVPMSRENREGLAKLEVLGMDPVKLMDDIVTQGIRSRLNPEPSFPEAKSMGIATGLNRYILKQRMLGEEQYW